MAPKTNKKMRMNRRKGLSTKGKGSTVNDVAAVSENFPFNASNFNTIYADYSCTLLQHERARQVAQGYQEYRIKLIEYRFKPLSDTYAPGVSQVPYLYYLVDKLRSNNGLQTIDAFTQAGAKAIRFDDKTIKVKYKPCVLLDSFDEGALTSLPRVKKISPWLATNDNSTIGAGFVPSMIDHNGIRWVVQGAQGDFTYQVERVVHIEFRKPMWIESPQAGEAIQVVDVATLARGLTPWPKSVTVTPEQ